MENCNRKSIAVLCDDGWLCKACPEIFMDESADPMKQISITDDFGHKIEMSKDQFLVLMKKAQSGELSV